MEEKDIIVRFSGDTKVINEALSEIAEKALALGLSGEDLQINKLTKKVDRKKVENRSTSDILGKATGDEATVEAFMNEVIERVSQDLGLETPSTSLKLSSQGNHGKKQ